jgi:HEAT repeat protein
MQATTLVSDGVFTGVAWALAQVVAVLLCLLLLQIIGMRAVLARRHWKAVAFRRSWEPLLASCVDTWPSRLPTLNRHEMPAFLLLWNYFQESVRDQAKERLNRIARRLGADDAALRYVRSRNIRNRLIALTALGHLRDGRCWDVMADIVRSIDPVVSLCAAKALMRIDAQRAAPIIVPLIAERRDWAPAGSAAVLIEGGPDAISEPLALAAENAERSRAPMLIRMLELTHGSASAPVLRRIMERNDETEIVAACLRVVQDPALLDVVRARLADPRWQIRVHAAHALGRLGTAQDEGLLVTALADEQWWVRYRAAQAIGALPSMDVGHLRDLSASVDDRFGRDILRQIVAERELAC